jgi:hypothetical protein
MPEASIFSAPASSLDGKIHIFRNLRRCRYPDKIRLSPGDDLMLISGLNKSAFFAKKEGNFVLN